MKFTLLLGGIPAVFAQFQSSHSSGSSLSSVTKPFNGSVSINSSAASTPVISSSLASRTVSINVGTSPVSSPKPTAYVNPWAGNFSSPVSQHGTGSDFALQCQNAWFSYTSINIDYIGEDGPHSFRVSTYMTTSTIRSTTVYEVHTYYSTSYYTLCDGHPRYINATPTATLTSTLQPSTTVFPVMGFGRDAYPTPNCTVSWDDCEGLWSRYTSASSVYQSLSFEKANTVVSLGPGASYWAVNGVTTTFPQPNPNKISLGTEDITRYTKQGLYLIITKPPPGGFFCACGHTMTAGGPPVTIQNTPDFTQTPYTPSCRTAKPTCTPGTQCKISGDRVEIYWFPPAGNVTRDMCAHTPEGLVTTRPPTNFTWTPITTGPYAVMPGNTTWFSGNVYVSLNRINGECNWSGTSVEVGEKHGGRVLTMAPSELYSLRATSRPDGFIDHGNHAYSFNLNDLISPYPWSAWVGGDLCAIDQCSTIRGSYNPRIAVPEAIRRLDPRWSTCDLDLGGLYDPPIALRSVGNMFATTTTPAAVGPAPTPGQSPPQADQPTHTPIQPGAPQTWQSSPPSIPSPLPQPNDPARPNPPEQSPDPAQGPGNGNPPAPTSAPIAPGPTTIGTVGTAPIVVNPANPTGINVGPSILTPGAPPITLGPGTTVSFQDPGHIIISTPGAAAPSTINVPRPVGNNVPAPSAGVVITMPNGELVTATAVIGEGHNGAATATSVLIAGTMFSVGGPPVTLSNGIVLSQAPSGTGVVVIDPKNGATSTVPFSSIPGMNNPGATPAPTALVTIGGRVYTATSQGGSVVVPELGLTITQGGPARTIDGTVVSDGGSKTGVIVGSSTASFPTPSASPTSRVNVATGGTVILNRAGLGSVACIIIGSVMLFVL